jgi:hypothetical protein
LNSMRKPLNLATWQRSFAFSTANGAISRRARKRLKGAKIVISGSEIAGERGPPSWSRLFPAMVAYCTWCFASRNCLRRRISRAVEGLRGQPRTMLRRAIPSFTVEVRRRPRLTTTSNADVQSSQSNPLQAAFHRASDRTAAAALGANIDSSPVDVAPSHPRGRILPSLVPDEPRHRRLEDAPVPATDSERPSRAPKRMSERARKRGDQASKSPWNSSFSSEEHAPSVERPSTNSQRTSSMQSDEAAGATTRARSQVVEDAPTLSANVRKRTIMARYVFGNEDKPGERWKRRLLRSR